MPEQVACVAYGNNLCTDNYVSGVMSVAYMAIWNAM